MARTHYLFRHPCVWGKDKEARDSQVGNECAHLCPGVTLITSSHRLNKDAAMKQEERLENNKTKQSEPAPPEAQGELDRSSSDSGATPINPDLVAELTPLAHQKILPQDPSHCHSTIARLQTPPTLYNQFKWRKINGPFHPQTYNAVTG